ncbi:MAG: hypothetical protein A2V67_02085 [Deltaproteobacteria bacterium RBG_13_61_14]|nr:MAG: hypothetical protein A2V67_02085 [Deltaproteobacteria bacterium RBG_13_61_14]
MKNKGRPCSAPGCDREATARGLCKRHYQKLSRRRSWSAMPKTKQGRPRVKPRRCRARSCDKWVVAKGLCTTHYQRQRRKKMPPRPRRPVGFRHLNEASRGLPAWLLGTATKAKRKREAWRHNLKLFPDRFRRLCVESGLNQRGLVSRLGLGKETICCYLAGSGPNLPHVILIARVFGVSTDWLLGLQEDLGSRAPAARRRPKPRPAKGFWPRFRRLFRQSRLNQSQFAARVGLSPAHVCYYLQGAVGPKPETVVKIARRCKVSADWLLGLSR